MRGLAAGLVEGVDGEVVDDDGRAHDLDGLLVHVRAHDLRRDRAVSGLESAARACLAAAGRRATQQRGFEARAQRHERGRRASIGAGGPGNRLALVLGFAALPSTR